MRCEGHRGYPGGLPEGGGRPGARTWAADLVTMTTSSRPGIGAWERHRAAPRVADGPTQAAGATAPRGRLVSRRVAAPRRAQVVTNAGAMAWLGRSRSGACVNILLIPPGARVRRRQLPGARCSLQRVRSQEQLGGPCAGRSRRIRGAAQVHWPRETIRGPSQRRRAADVADEPAERCSSAAARKRGASRRGHPRPGPGSRPSRRP